MLTYLWLSGEYFVCSWIWMLLQTWQIVTAIFFTDPTETEPESPTVLLWTLYFLSQHYDHLGNIEEALSCINRAIDHTPTLIELFMARAKIFKVTNSLFFLLSFFHFIFLCVQVCHTMIFNPFTQWAQINHCLLTAVLTWHSTCQYAMPIVYVIHNVNVIPRSARVEENLSDNIRIHGMCTFHCILCLIVYCWQ